MTPSTSLARWQDLRRFYLDGPVLGGELDAHERSCSEVSAAVAANGTHFETPPADAIERHRGSLT